MEQRVLIDPPGGYFHGFAREYVGEIETLDFNAWLVAEGYPRHLVEEYPQGVPCKIVRRHSGESVDQR